MERTSNILSAIFDSNDDVWFFISPDYSIQFFNNKAFENSLLYHNKKLKAGDNILDYARDTKNSTEAFVQNFKRAVEGQIVKEEQQIQFGSSTIWTRSKFIPVYDAGILLGISLTVEDITKEKLMEQDQVKFQEEIIMLSNKREEFINIASHELKTPLSSLKASVQIIENIARGNSNTVSITPFIRKANTSITKLTKLINDLLNINKIERGGLQLEKSAFILSELISSCCDHVRSEGTHQIILNGDLDLEVFADKDRIDQIVVNLVNNAVKYAPNSKDIIITIEGHSDHAKVSVQDFGPGIPHDKAKNIFKRYYRVDDGNKYYSGMGLGLYISEEIIKKHHGEIGVETETGKGSTFWFTLPVAYNR